MILDAAGRPVELGGKLGEGGEGAVWEVRGRPNLVAKVYSSPSPGHDAKIRALCDPRFRKLSDWAAWPAEPLFGRRSGPVVGFTMPRITGCRSIYDLYNPRQRLRHFPDADWRFLIHVAANAAAAVAELHRAGVVVGDLNHGNMLVHPVEGTVRVIDCDSIQVEAAGQRHLCHVGVPAYLAPELHGRPMDTTWRTPNHDAFSLAVLAFHLLMFGRHPFAGQFVGSGPPIEELEEAMRRFLFAYGPHAPTRGMRPPPGTLDPAALTPPVLGLFDRAFSARGASGGRPSAEEWTAGLRALRDQLVVCRNFRRHHRPRSMADCPFCAVERGFGVVFFPARSAADHAALTPGGAFDLASFLRQVAGVAEPGPPPPFPAGPSAPSPSPEALAVANARREAAERKRHFEVEFRRFGEARSRRIAQGWMLFAAAVLLTLVVPEQAKALVFIAGTLAAVARGTTEGGAPAAPAGPAVAVDGSKLEAWQKRLNQVAGDIDVLQRRWRQDLGNAAFARERQALDTLHREYEGLPELRSRMLDALQAKRRDLQLHRFLDAITIESASIKGLGEGRKRMLASYGVETAADINEAIIRRVPGFGDGLTNRLLEFRENLIRKRFRYDPGAPLDPADIASVEEKVLRRRLELECKMISALSELRGTAARINGARQTMRHQVEALLCTRAQLEADIKVATR